jgi:hypothetical protein
MAKKKQRRLKTELLYKEARWGHGQKKRLRKLKKGGPVVDLREKMAT